MTGTLYGLGVGPGAPDLLTLRAVNVLRTVDVILAAASPRNDYSAALDTARPHLRADARLLRLEFPMTRDAGILRAAWLKAAEAARDVLEGGENAAFLTIGDPLVYSTFGYLLRTLREVAPTCRWRSCPALPPFRPRPHARARCSAKAARSCAFCPASTGGTTWPRNWTMRTQR